MLLTIVEKWKGESSREYVTRLLKFNIINLYLHPGEAISENEIAAQLNLSRTPVREAFIRLAQDRLINVFPQKGTSISKIGESSGDEGRFIRRVVEKELVKELCQKEDNAFFNRFLGRIPLHAEILCGEEQYRQVCPVGR